MTQRVKQKLVVTNGTQGSEPGILERKLGDVASGLLETKSVPVQVADALRKLILSGQLRPGDRVIEWKIARQLNIGQPTAREALLLLENEGLLQRNPNRGCTVTSLDREQIDQIYRVRIELESLAAELAVENAANWQPAVLKAALKRLADAARKNDIEAWHQADLEFHQTLWRLANNPFLEKALAQISVPFFAFAELVFLETHPQDLAQQAKQHEVFVAAILSGDKKQARETTRKVLTDFWQLWRKLKD